MLDTELIPATQPDASRLMIVLHGLGDSMEGYRWLSPALNLPWLNYLLVNAPDEYYGGYSWFDFAGDPLPGIRRSRELLFELLDAQRAAGFATDQTVLFGFSQGCLMTWETGMRYGQRFAGLIGISGYVVDPKTLLAEQSPLAKTQRFLVTHGTYDPLLPIAQVKPQIELFKSGGINVEWHEFRKEHTIAGEEEIRVIRDFVVAGFEVEQASKAVK
jgi:phospholipase/carboxylesterase